MPGPDDAQPRHLGNFTDLILEEGRRDAPFTVHAELRQGLPYIVIQGSMNLVARERFIEEIGRFFSRLGHKGVVLDLSHCVRLTSSALGILLAMNDAIADHGGCMVLLRPNTHIDAVLSALGLENYWVTVESHAEAEAFFRRHDLLGDPPSG
ncbi:MAG: STAS domain-containing protein [Planctomycetota bacterium]